jgi:hypothetical protein
MDFDSVSRELYGLLPEEFAAARKAKASEAQAEGNRDLATAIRQLRRPTTSAWLANLLVRERPAEIATLLELGTAMLKAQSDLAGAEMRRLSQQRQQVVTPLSDAARKLSHDMGKDISESTIRELEETLDAAIANSDARDALASGHLASAMRYSGLGGVDLSGVAVKRSKSASRTATTSKVNPNKTATDPTPRDTLLRAERVAAEHSRQRQVALEEVERCSRAIAEAEDLLRSLRSQRKHAQAELLKAERSLSASQTDRGSR